MQIKLSPRFILAFLSLTFVLHEAHEIAHTAIGRMLCGCWGVRDFNQWSTCNGCDENVTWIATLSGPVFTFTCLWLGAFLLARNNSQQKKAAGFALVFASMPFGRIFNPIFGGGDETVVIDHFIHDFDQANLYALVVIIAICVFPLYRVFISIQNKNRIGWFLLFLLAPFALDLLLILGVMNTLLLKGVLSEHWILGSPMLVTVWTILVSVLFLFGRRGLLPAEGALK